jgi:2-oxoglutarate ferredoxin oxidoreductase subunit alpha
MNEFLGLAYFAEVPAVLIDVQRTGPSTGMPTRTQQSDITSAAYASHGDTKHVLLFPSDPAECFELTAQSFDLAERLQTPIIVMTDLDLGMNDHMSAPYAWDDSRVYDRGKVLSAEDLENIGRFGRYLDMDGDGIPYRTIPSVHPSKGAYVTRGSSRDEYAAYTEDSAAYKRNMDRLAHKFETAKSLVPGPVIHATASPSTIGMLYFGTSTHSAEEARDLLTAEGINVDALRLRAFPFNDDVEAFIRNHERVFVIEQNRDAQMRSLLITELDMEPSRFKSVLNYDGMPITADAIVREIKEQL